MYVRVISDSHVWRPVRSVRPVSYMAIHPDFSFKVNHSTMIDSLRIKFPLMPKSSCGSLPQQHHRQYFLDDRQQGKIPLCLPFPV